MKNPEQFLQKLLVEGSDDLIVIKALCSKCQTKISFDIRVCDGKENLKKQLKHKVFREPDIKTIGIIIDADNDVSSSWKSISNLLKDQNFKVPKKIPSDGFIGTNGKEKDEEQKVGVWIMPDNIQHGMLEDFITYLMPKDDQLFTIASDVIDKIELDGLHKYEPIYKAKTLIHTWHAWQAKPRTSMGQNIRDSNFTSDHETCLKLIAWLNKLFN